MNAAHIMNDEATRKYLQAIKRLLTFMQRARPTEPSRCVDFDAHRDAGRGGAGAGSDKLVSGVGLALTPTAALLVLLLRFLGTVTMRGSLLESLSSRLVDTEAAC